MADYDTWTPTQEDIDIRIQGCKFNAEAKGLDVTDPAVIMFIEHTAKVMATMDCEIRFIRSKFHPENTLANQ